MTQYSKPFLWKKKWVRPFIFLLLWMGPIIIFLCFPKLSHCIELFEKVFQVNNEGTDGHSVFPLTDGYLVNNGQYANGYKGFSFAKFDLTGKFDFAKEFSADFWPRSAKKTSDGGYLIACIPGGTLVKLDQNLKQQWVFELGMADVLSIRAKETSDGGYIVGLGVTQTTKHGGILVTKLNADRTLAWTRQIRGSATLAEYKGEVYDIFETDTGYIIYGEFSDEKSLRLVSFKKNGDLYQDNYINAIDSSSEFPFGGDGGSTGSSIIQIGTEVFGPDVLMIAHEYKKQGVYNYSITWKDNILLIPFDKNSLTPIKDQNNKYQVKMITGIGGTFLAGCDGVPNLIMLEDGNILLGGYAQDFPFLIKLKPSLSNILWQNVYQPKGNWAGGRAGWFHGLSEVVPAGVVTEGRIAAVGGFNHEYAHFMILAEDGTNDGTCFNRLPTNFYLQLEELYILPKYTLTVQKLYYGSGKVTSSPDGIDCGSDCSEPYVEGTAVTLVANAYNGYFQGWSGSCSGTKETCTVTMDKDKTVTATFGGTSGYTLTNEDLVTYPGTLDAITPPITILVSYPPVVFQCGLVPPNIVVTPQNLVFNSICIGKRENQTITVQNTGESSLTLTISKPTAMDPFTIITQESTCITEPTLSAGSKCTIMIGFEPTSPVLFVTSFNIETDPPIKPFSVTLSGTGEQCKSISVTPPNLEFDSICIGKRENQTITVENTGESSLTLIISKPIAPFTIIQESTCITGPTLPAKGSKCTIVIGFEPTFTGAVLPASFNIEIDPLIPPYTVELRGTGKQGIPHIRVIPIELIFDLVAERQISDKDITVINEGECPNTPLNLTAIGDGNPQTPFEIVGGTCKVGTTLLKGKDCSIVVRFAPTQAGPFTSSFNVNSDDPGAPTVTVNLKGGSGPDLVGELSSSLVKKCINTQRGKQCTITFSIKIMNIGTKDAAPS